MENEKKYVNGIVIKEKTFDNGGSLINAAFNFKVLMGILFLEWPIKTSSTISFLSIYICFQINSVCSLFFDRPINLFNILTKFIAFSFNFKKICVQQMLM